MLILTYKKTELTFIWNRIFHLIYYIYIILFGNRVFSVKPVGYQLVFFMWNCFGVTWNRKVN